MAKNRQAGMDFIDALPDDGERRLMLAVLIDAIRNLAHDGGGLGPRARMEWLRDREWMRRDDPKSPFSFVSICTALNLNPSYVRRRVRQLQRSEHGLSLHRYAAKAEEAWDRQRRPDGIARLFRSDVVRSDSLLGDIARRPPAESRPRSQDELEAIAEQLLRRLA